MLIKVLLENPEGRVLPFTSIITSLMTLFSVNAYRSSLMTYEDRLFLLISIEISE